MDQTYDWAARLAADVGSRVADCRAKRGLTARELAGRCAALGMPSLTRIVITKLENGRREVVSVAELAVLAAALGVTPLLLLHPAGTAESAEYLPGKRAAPWDAVRWWSGEAGLSPDGAIGPAPRRSAASLFRSHQQLLSGLPPDVTEAAWRAARWHAAPGRSEKADPAARAMMLNVIAVQETRESIRELGLEPPALPPGLEWIEAS